MIKLTPNAVLREELEALRDRIIANHQAAGQVASGKTIQSMKVNVDGDSGELVGRKRFFNLEQGEPPWKNAATITKVPKSFNDTIQQWITEKGLNLNSWAVAYKIIKQGTMLYREGGRTDIYSNEIPKTVENIGKRILVIYDQMITETINDTKK